MMRPHNDSGNAETALQATAGCECVGEAVSLFGGKALEGHHLLAGDRPDRLLTRDHRTAIDEHCAAPALTRRRAAVLWGGDVEFLAKRRQQVRVVSGDIDRRTVHDERNTAPLGDRHIDILSKPQCDLPHRVCDDDPMSVVKINAIEVPPGSGAELEARFAARAGSVDQQPGFEEFMLLRPVAGDDRYFVVTRWESEEAFQDWRSGQAFAHQHRETHTEDGHGEAKPQHPVATGASLLEFEVVSLTVGAAETAP